MENKSQAIASFQIGIGIVCILMGVAALTQDTDVSLGAISAIIGAVSLARGYVANRNEKMERYQTLSLLVSALSLLATALMIYRIFHLGVSPILSR